MSEEVQEMARRLAAPFPADVVGWKAQAVSGERALAVAYIDARDVMDRLDEVVGVLGWQDNYECLPDGAVICRLRVRVGDEWITKEDVGGQSDQKDEGDRRKAAFSDALKRAAVKFGIGRFLYSLKPQWVDYDPKTKQIKGTPRLLPVPVPVPAAAPAKPPAPASEPAPNKKIAATDGKYALQGLFAPGALSSAYARALAADPALSAVEATKAWVEQFLAARNAEPASRDDQAALDGELRRTGETWVRCRAKLGASAPKERGDLARGEVARLLKLLMDLPDAPADGGKR